ncbi:MAG: synthase delta subunit [Candidatus Saccharibacteria bacterium]|nr:synthase delta subunit [Candidatus Saccharibacteria bacterium]
MKTARTRIANVIADNTLKSGVSKTYVNEIAAYLLSEQRVGELDSLLRDVQADWAAAGFVEVIATSAHPLTAAIKADIIKQFKQLYPEAKKIIVTEAHDPTILGGVRLSLADKQLDLSVEAKLNKFKQLTTAGKDT